MQKRITQISYCMKFNKVEITINYEASEHKCMN